MAWIVLILSAVFEAVWATALGYTQGLSMVVPTVVFVVTFAISMVGLAYAAKRIPIGTAYAVWSGLGAALTVAYAILTGDEVASVWRIVFLTGIVAGTVGLKLASDKAPTRSPLPPRR
ncbi:MAG: multidrug efflux SMR transporter [Mycobacterium sp.]